MHTITSCLIKCPDCKAVAKAESFPFHYDLKIQFSSEFGEYKIMMYKFQVEAYYNMKKMPIPSDEDDLVLGFLSDDKTNIICNLRNTCVGLENC